VQCVVVHCELRAVGRTPSDCRSAQIAKTDKDDDDDERRHHVHLQQVIQRRLALTTAVKCTSLLRALASSYRTAVWTCARFSVCRLSVAAFSGPKFSVPVFSDHAIHVVHFPATQISDVLVSDVTAMTTTIIIQVKPAPPVKNMGDLLEHTTCMSLQMAVSAFGLRYDTIRKYFTYARKLTASRQLNLPRGTKNKCSK